MESLEGCEIRDHVLKKWENKIENDGYLIETREEMQWTRKDTECMSV